MIMVLTAFSRQVQNHRPAYKLRYALTIICRAETQVKYEHVHLKNKKHQHQRNPFEHIQSLFHKAFTVPETIDAADTGRKVEQAVSQQSF